MAGISQYKEEYIERVDDYLKQCVDEEEEFHKTRGEKSDSYERILKVKLPSMAGFCMYLGIVKSTLYKWKDENPKFSDSLGKILIAQERVILEKSISGEYNPTIAKLILSSNHGYKEKQDITSNGETILGNTINFIDGES